MELEDKERDEEGKLRENKIIITNNKENMLDISTLT